LSFEAQEVADGCPSTARRRIVMRTFKRGD
jgi:hypothetical protein